MRLFWKKPKEKVAGVVERRKMLTPRGWPRPVHDGWPVPWISPRNALKQTDPDRHSASVHAQLCQVCGQGFEPDDTVFMFINDRPPETYGEMAGKLAFAMDDAILHERCAKLVLGRCPGVRGVWEKKNLWVIRSQARFVDIWYDHSDNRNWLQRLLRRPRGRSGGIDPDEPRVAADGYYSYVMTPEQFLGREDAPSEAGKIR